MTDLPPELTLFVRRDCHLCDAAEQVVRRVIAERAGSGAVSPTLALADIDDPATPALLRAHYDHHVPVLHLSGVELARHRVEPEAVHTALDLAAVTFCVLGKYPEPGRVKTRLTKGDLALTPEQAAGVHRVFMLHLLRRLGELRPARLVLCFDPPSPESREHFAALLKTIEPSRLPVPRPVELLPQSAGDLGDRLATAAEALSGPLLLFGCDAPDIPTELFLEATRLLVRPAEPGQPPEADAVLAPTSDGGYWTIGISRSSESGKPSLREVLHGIPWSSGHEYAATVERFTSSGYRCCPASPWDDVDHPADLLRLMDRLSGSSAPDDRRLLESLRTVLDQQGR